jgi:hypothetical protein
MSKIAMQKHLVAIKGFCEKHPWAKMPNDGQVLVFCCQKHWWVFPTKMSG